MREAFSEQLSTVRDELVEMAGRVRQAVADATIALIEADGALASSVIDSDVAIDLLRVKIEEDSFQMMALQSPVATDLRMLVAGLRMVSDLERMGDLAKKIGKNVSYLCGVPPTSANVDFRDIAEKARLMVKRSMDAFVNGDADLARQVLADDDEVDRLKDELYEELRNTIRNHPDELDSLLKLYSVTRNLERLGDMATHIAEEVIFIIEGDIVRHNAGA